MRSDATNLNGPLPIASVTCFIASVIAECSGMITQYTCASALGSNAKGRLSRKRITLSDGAEISSTRAISAPPNGSRLEKRSMDAAQSFASTGVPS